MLRRLALLTALLVPTAGLAQIAGKVLVVPAALGVADCTSSTTYVTIAWTSTITPVTGDVYNLYVSSVSSGACPTTGTPPGTQLGGDIPALGISGTYPVTGTLTRHDFISAAGIADTACVAGGTSTTINVCVQQLAGSVVRATMSGSVPLELENPPAPVNVSVASGDSALYVSWSNGTDNGVAPTSYRVTAEAVGNPGDTHTESYTGTSNQRISGLTNGVTYSVWVVAVSAGGNQSTASVAVTGTPQHVADFWEQYKGAGGQEQGGCGGGPAGLVSLLGVALALRGLRRRS